MSNKKQIKQNATITLSLKEAFAIQEILRNLTNSKNHFGNPLFLSISEKIDNAFLN